MCGRYALEIPIAEMAARFGVPVEAAAQRHESHDNVPHYNIAPTQKVPVIHDSALKMASWGWSVFQRPPQMNARSETITEKPSFRNDFAHGRCLFPATAFYEWQAAGEHQGQPYAVRHADQPLFAFAGLWRHYQEKEECVIITQPACAALADIHPRQPVVLPERLWADWQTLPAAQALQLLHYQEQALCAHPVSKAVNRAAANSAELLAPTEIAPPPQMALL